MATLVYFDVNGNETKREERTGRGRYPKNAKKQENGEIHIHPVNTVTKTVVEYVTVDSNGNVLSREPKTRGRTKPGFVFAEDGDNKGHWVKVQSEDKVPV